MVSVCMDSFRRWSTNPRIYVITALSTMMVYGFVAKPIHAFSAYLNVPVAPWLFAFLYDDFYITILSMLGAVLLFCDAPFINQGTPYLFIRSGRNRWFSGQVLYVIIASLVYQVFLMLICALLMVPRLEWTCGWGKTLGTLAQTNEGLRFQAISVSYTTQLMFTPIQAIAVALGMAWLITMLVGMLMFVVNLLAGRAWGPVFGCSLAFITVYGFNAPNEWLRFLTPGVWMGLGTLRIIHTRGYPSYQYAITASLCSISVLTLIAFLAFRRRAIEILPTI